MYIVLKIKLTDGLKLFLSCYNNDCKPERRGEPELTVAHCTTTTPRSLGRAQSARVLFNNTLSPSFILFPMLNRSHKLCG